MSFTIAVAGKGGTGKSTLAALMILKLVKNGKGAVLAVDADPNVNLNGLLGIEMHQTVGGLREETLKVIKKGDFPAGMSKSMYLKLGLEECLIEDKGLDLLVMGRQEGPGCYCLVNSILREFLDSISKNYRYVIIDNEAGMEHLSRRTTRDVNMLLLVSDDNLVSLRSAGNISRMGKELDLAISKKYLILNNVRETIPLHLEKEIEENDLTLLAKIPQDEFVSSLSKEGRSLKDLPENSPALRSVANLLEKLNLE
ncbi:carbon monoxide dehydrogenase [Candidatus Aerophobetes bacterium]|uniref:Carbon monoxide dehydrogenase n=1 Tax=Aerophobetes bacterium TaxID=2030807 RepID=A0A523WCE1_UNCAE|nr:MAG: carbon monoxide dehydrogenase [Candidatus Aerophobetes bacterium]